MAEVIDHQARQDAALAKQAMTAHDDRCEERWAESRKLMDAMLAEVRGLRSSVDEAKGGWKMLLGMLSAAGAAGAAISWVLQHIKIGG
jgi:hypothetical protein